MTDTNVNHFQESGTDHVCKVSVQTEYRTAAMEYNRLLDGLRARYPEANQELLDLDSAVGACLAAAEDYGAVDGTAPLEARIAELERMVEAMRDTITTRHLRIVDEAGAVHITADAGEDFATLILTARDGYETDEGPTLSLAASEETDPPHVFAVARLGLKDQVIGAIGTDHPYGKGI